MPFFYLGIRDGLFNRGFKGTELELACQRANLARGASANIVREQGLFPYVVWPPGLKARGRKGPSFKKRLVFFRME